jgi:hypothetical protein
MIFTRTLSGIANFAQFVGCDILVYTEGKENSAVNDEIIFDEIFYLSLITQIYPDKAVKVKCLGSRIEVLRYASMLEGMEASSSVVIVDRDGEDLTCTLLPRRNIIYTYGYSWENDFWTQVIAQEVLEDLACSHQHSEFLCSQYRLVTKRLALLSAMDICSHLNKELLLPKNGGGCGIDFKFSSLHVIPYKDAHRLIMKYKDLDASTSPLCRFILPIAMRTMPERTIQGHLWEYVVLNLIIFAIKGLGRRGLKVPYQLVKNLAMTKFKKNCRAYLNPPVIEHYRYELERRFG